MWVTDDMYTFYTYWSHEPHMVHELHMSHELHVWVTNFIKIAVLCLCLPRMEEISFAIITTAEISNNFHGSPRTFQSGFHGSHQNFKHVFTGVNGVPITQKVCQEN